MQTSKSEYSSHPDTELQFSYKIIGNVQGVGFRYYTQFHANKFGVTGYVRNQSDGSVVCVASAKSKQLTKFENALREGPLNARIDQLDKRESNEKLLPNFHIF